jgi:hypothetical protein
MRNAQDTHTTDQPLSVLDALGALLGGVAFELRITVGPRLLEFVHLLWVVVVVGKRVEDIGRAEVVLFSDEMRVQSAFLDGVVDREDIDAGALDVRNLHEFGDDAIPALLAHWYLIVASG